jgi:hypothetical protein
MLTRNEEHSFFIAKFFTIHKETKLLQTFELSTFSLSLPSSSSLDSLRAKGMQETKSDNFTGEKNVNSERGLARHIRHIHITFNIHLVNIFSFK